MSMRLVIPLLLLGVLLAGCGEEKAVVIVDPGGTPYDGPMYVELDFSDRATPLEASGAAGLALECDGKPYRGGGVGYDDGLLEVQDSPEAALANWLDDEWATVPDDGYALERVDDGRALLSWAVDYRTRVAVMVKEDVTDYQDDTGWGVEAWASCDPSELGVEAAEELGIQLWEDEYGDPVATSDVVSFPGAEHCDWQDTTWLRVGAASDIDRTYDEYLSNDDGGELADHLTTAADDSATLPGDATDTGWRRAGRELWIGDHPRAAYLVSVDDERDVELWPATKKPIGCG